MWLKHFNEAIKLSNLGNVTYREDHFFTRIFNFYLINYYSPAQASTFKLNINNQEVPINP